MDCTDGPPSPRHKKKNLDASDSGSAADGAKPHPGHDDPLYDNINKKDELTGMFEWEKHHKDPKLPLNHSNIAAENGSKLYYKMEKRSHGLIIIINNRNFLNREIVDGKHRNGTDVDALELKHLFLKKGFDVDLHRDLTCQKMVDAINNTVETMSEKPGEYSCVACAILTHGDINDAILGIDEISICFEELRAKFCVEKLAGKPKLFFVQACRGRKYMESYDVTDSPSPDKKSSLPTEADCLCAHSTISGYYSFRSEKGSWFIQSLVQVFREHSHQMDIIRMLTRVNNVMSERFSDTGEHKSHNKRQVLAITSHLRYEFFFFPPWGKLDGVKA